MNHKTNHFAFLFGLMLLIASASGHAEKTLVAVAANFTHTAQALKPMFEKQTGHQISFSFGSTGKLYAQIRHGAPYDVFLSADASSPERLEKDGIAIEDSRFTYAQGKLLLWSPMLDVSEHGLAPALIEKIRFLAIANPATAPYGRASIEALKHMGYYNEVSENLVFGESVSQTFQFIATKHADLGFVAHSQWQHYADQSGFIWPVPKNVHASIDQQAVLLKRGKDNEAARAFLAFLRNNATRSFIRDQGYDLPNDEIIDSVHMSQP